MLGYVRICKPELKVREYELYRGLYCTLCRTLGKRYGLFSRLLLSYDSTFFVLVVLAVESINPEFKGGRCPFNPIKKCNYCQNAGADFDLAAALTVIMFYYKVKDNIKDTHGYKKILMYLILPFAAVKRKKAFKFYPEIDCIISKAMLSQSEAELSGTNDLDIAAHSSANALGEIFCLSDKNNENLYRFGYMVGRWVYFIDAADDIEADLKDKSFNVFVNKFNLTAVSDITDKITAQIEATLNFSCAQATKACHELEITVMFPIIENILLDGMNGEMNKVLKGKYNQ